MWVGGDTWVLENTGLGWNTCEASHVGSFRPELEAGGGREKALLASRTMIKIEPLFLGRMNTVRTPQSQATWQRPYMQRQQMQNKKGKATQSGSVVHDALEALVLFPDKILHRNLRKPVRNPPSQPTRPANSTRLVSSCRLGSRRLWAELRLRWGRVALQAKGQALRGRQAEALRWTEAGVGAPRRFRFRCESLRALTSSMVMYVVPDDHTPMHFICFVSRPAIPFSRSSRLMPPMPSPPVRTATVK